MKRNLISVILMVAMIAAIGTANVFATECTLMDVALNKPVYTSSDFGYAEGDKTYLVDNETEGQLTYWQPAAGESITATKAIVDLTQRYDIHRIELTMTSKRSFQVAVSNDKDDNSSWVTVHSQGNTAFSGDTLTIIPSLGEKYRFVRISRRPGAGMSDTFQVSSLRVYAPGDFNLTEVASGQPVSTHTNGASYEKGENVVDRNYNSMVFAAKTQTHPQYFTIDLGEEKDVRRVELMQAIKDTSYFNNGIQPVGQPMREGWGSVQYSIYLGDEDVTPDIFLETAEKVAEYGAVQNWGVAHSITAFDICASKSYRYVHVVASNLTSAFRVAELFVYAASEETSETVETENILLQKPIAFQNGNTNPSYANDSDETTAWTLESSEDYATFQLNGVYHIRSLELSSENLSSDFEIWGGNSPDFSEDTKKIRLFSGESATETVNLANAVQYLTVKPSAQAIFPISLAELGVYAEKGIRLVNISGKATVSEDGLSDGLYESVPTQKAMITAEESVAALQIYFGENEDGRRNITILGGTTEDDLIPIATFGARSIPLGTPYTLMLNEEQSSYRCFAVQKDMEALSGGVNVGGVYQFTEASNLVDITEMLLYTKKENVPPPTSAVELRTIQAVDAAGNLVSDLSGASVGAKLSLKNKGTAPEDAVVICALVDEKSLVLDCSLERVTLSAQEEKEITVMAGNISAEACGLKVFLWQGYGEKQIPHTIHKTLLWKEN